MTFASCYLFPFLCAVELIAQSGCGDYMWWWTFERIDFWWRHRNKGGQQRYTHTDTHTHHEAYGGHKGAQPRSGPAVDLVDSGQFGWKAWKLSFILLNNKFIRSEVSVMVRFGKWRAREVKRSKEIMFQGGWFEKYQMQILIVFVFWVWCWSMLAISCF